MFLSDCSARYSCSPRTDRCYLQVNGDTLAPQVIDSQHTANDVATQVVENEDFPYRLPSFSKDRLNVVWSGCHVLTWAVCM